jgi:hypothetical protein
VVPAGWAAGVGPPKAPGPWPPLLPPADARQAARWAGNCEELPRTTTPLARSCAGTRRPGGRPPPHEPQPCTTTAAATCRCPLRCLCLLRSPSPLHLEISFIYILDKDIVPGGNQHLRANYGNFNLNHMILIQGKTYERWE